MASGTVKIGKRNYKVVKRRMKCKGYFEDSSKTIAIRPGMRKIAEAKTLLHEIYHGIFAEYIRDILTDDEEERVIRALERGITEFARHNPEQWLVLANRLTK